MVALTVLLAATAVALWPLLGPALGQALGSALWSRGTAPEPAAPPAPDLATLRERAALAPCPGTQGPGTQGPGTQGEVAASGVLAGVSVPCLGDGGTVPLGAALTGRVTLLNVWSHTCEPCRDELPVLQEYATSPGAVDVLGVQVDGPPQAGLALLTALSVHLPSVTDPDAAVLAALAAPPVLPLSYLVSADGSVRMVNPPVVFRSADEVAAVVQQYRVGA